MERQSKLMSVSRSASAASSPRLLKADLYLASSLCDGVEDNDLTQVTTLLKNKEADPNVLMPLHGITPFHLVIGNDSEAFAEEVTKLFLRYGGNPNVRSVDGMTPVHVAAAWGRTRILDLLLANGGDPLCLDYDCCSPFNYAFQGDHQEAVEILSKYCFSDDEIDEDIKYKLELDKILVNNGEVLAEYLVSDSSFNNSNNSASFVSSDSRLYQNKVSGYNPDTGSSGSNSISSDFVTVRKNQRKRVINEKTSNIEKAQEKDEYDFRRKTVKEELELLNDIISQLSNSMTSDVDASSNTFKSYESECLVSCKTSSPKRMQMTMTFNRPVKYSSNGKFAHSEQNFDRNNISNKTLDIIKRHNNVPKLKGSQMSTNSSRKTPTLTNKSTTIKKSSTSSSARKITPNRPKQFHTPVKDKVLDSKWFDETIISKSPNLHITVNSNERKKSKLLKTPIFEKKASPLTTKINKKKPSSVTPVKVKSPNNPNNNSKKRTPVSRIPRPKKYFPTPVSNLKTVVRKGSVVQKVSPSKKTSAGKKGRYFSPLNITYSMSESSTASSSNYKSQNKEERRKSLKDVAVNLSQRMDENAKDIDEEPPKNKNHNAEFNQLLQISNFMSGVQMLDSGITSKSESRSEHTSNEEFLNVREESAELNEAIANSLTSANTMSKLSDLDINDKSHRKDVNPLDSMLVQQGSFSCSLSSESFISASDANHAQFDNKVNNRSSNSSSGSTSSNDKEAKLAALFDDSASSSEKSDSESFLSIEEEYKYEDFDEGVVLLERRLCVSPSYASSNMSTSFYSISTTKSEPLPKELYLLDSRMLRERLKSVGENPGPITNTTYHLYLKRLHRLVSDGKKPVKSVKKYHVPSSNAIRNQPSQSFDTTTRERGQLHPSLLSIDWIQNIDDVETLERKVFQEFVNPDPSRKWREGTGKSSFNYLLLDPRITKDLPRRAARLSLSEKWETFLSAIFYVGKGKCSRPYKHLYDAIKMWVNKNQPRSNNSKIQKILDIWNARQGVVVLHVFHNTIPVEAYTREAAMIEVLGTNRLGNCKYGDYYGVVATWRSREKCELGRYMLFKAMQILLLEGERQIFPDNL